MPIGAWAQIQYWARGDGLQSAPRLTKGGYPAWQSSVILGSTFGWCQILWERCTWWVIWLRRLWRLTIKERAWLDARVDHLVRLSEAPEERRLILNAVEDLLDSVAYAEARGAVQETATTLGFNRPQAWVKLSHTLKDLSPWAENSWRHLNAMWLLEQRLTELRIADKAIPMLTNPERNLLIELAYSGFAAKPKN